MTEEEDTEILAIRVRNSIVPLPDIERNFAEIRREAIGRALQTAATINPKGVRSFAARLLGVHRDRLARIMKKEGIS